MTLREAQSRFVLDIARLIEWAYSRGYELTWGEAYRPPEMAEIHARAGRGIANSLHGDRLAVDFNLFEDGKYLSASEDHRPLGEYWESLDPANRWGGRFNDGNHYSRSIGDGRS